MENENLNIAVQASGQPTNKVSATGTAAGGIAAVLAGVMTAYIGPAIMEQLGSWGTANPSTAAFLVALAAALAGFFATKYGGQAAAYNVLDKPNIPLISADKVEVVEETKDGDIEENKPE